MSLDKPGDDSEPPTRHKCPGLVVSAKARVWFLTLRVSKEARVLEAGISTKRRWSQGWFQGGNKVVVVTTGIAQGKAYPGSTKKHRYSLYLQGFYRYRRSLVRPAALQNRRAFDSTLSLSEVIHGLSST